MSKITSGITIACLLLCLQLFSCMAFGQVTPIPLPTPAPIADPIPNAGKLDAEVIQTELQVESATISRKQFKFGKAEISTTREVVDKSSYKQHALLVIVSTEAKHINVVARTSLKDFGEVVETSKKKYLVIGPPGDYVIEVDTFDPTLGIERTFKNGTILPSDDAPTEDPDIPPVGDFAELAKLAVDLARQMDDEPTRQAIVSELGKVLFTLTADEIDFDTARKSVQSAIQAAMETRAGESLRKDWFEGFRKPVDAAFSDAGIANKSDFVGAWTAIQSEMTKQFKTVIPKAIALPQQVQPIQSTATYVVPYRAPEPRYERRQVVRQVCDNGRCRYVWVWETVLVP